MKLKRGISCSCAQDLRGRGGGGGCEGDIELSAPVFPIIYPYMCCGLVWCISTSVYGGKSPFYAPGPFPNNLILIKRTYLGIYHVITDRHRPSAPSPPTGTPKFTNHKFYNAISPYGFCTTVTVDAASQIPPECLLRQQTILLNASSGGYTRALNASSGRQSCHRISPRHVRPRGRCLP